MKYSFLTILLIFFAGKLFAWEKLYDFNSLTQFYTHYSIVNSSGNDGLVTAGNEKNVGAYSAHAMKVDYSGNMVWSKSYSFSTSWNTLCYRITNDNNNGYLLTGMNQKIGSPGVFGPMVIRLDANGNAINMTMIPCNGVGLTIRSCPNGDVIVGGFESDTYTDYAPGNRAGFLCRMDMNFNIIWYKRITGQQVAGYYNFDHVEVVLPLEHNGNQYYYVSGGITKDISTPGNTKTNIVMLSQLYDINGNLVWNNSQLEDFNGVDAAYNPGQGEIYMIANGNLNIPYVTNYYRLDVNTGAITKSATYEGNPNATPIGCHITYANKINYINNQVIIYGYSRDYRENQMIQLDRFIPYRIVTDRDFTMPSIELFMFRTHYYAIPGLLGTHGWNIYNSFHTADMAVDFAVEGVNHFALIGYDKDQMANPYALHIAMDAVPGDCTPQETEMEYQDFISLPVFNVGHINIPKPNPPPLNPVSTDLTFYDRICNWMCEDCVQLPPGNTSNDDDKGIGAGQLYSVNFNDQEIKFIVLAEVKNYTDLKIYTMNGQLLKTLKLSEGSNSLNLDLTEGIYILELCSGQDQSRKVFVQP